MDEAVHHESQPRDRFEVHPNIALAVVLMLILGMIAVTGGAIYAFNN